MKRPHFALPEIYDDSLSYYDVLRKLIKSMHAIVDNLNKIPEQIANEAKAREQADGTLQTNIDNEKQSREQADQEIREGVSNKISELKGDLGDLAPAGASVGQLFRVAAISVDGKYTMEPVDMPSGGITDVQVDGKTVVVDNVANIPIVTKTSPGITPKIGGGLAINNNTLIISAPTSYGLHVWGADLGLDRTSYKQVDDRAPKQLLAIQTGTIDYAVKAAMCDGKGAKWTDAERIAALLRMGCTVDENGFVKWTVQEVTN